MLNSRHNNSFTSAGSKYFYFCAGYFDMQPGITLSPWQCPPYDENRFALLWLTYHLHRRFPLYRGKGCTR